MNPVRVAFVFVDGKTPIWEGGKNYFLSLFQSLTKYTPDLIEPVVFAGSSSLIHDLGLPAGLLVIYDSVFCRGSFRWLLDTVFRKLTGRPILTNRIVCSSGIQIRSHGTPSMSRRIKSIGWIPDFQHLHLPHFFSDSELRARDLNFKTLLSESDLVIVSSENAAEDLGRFYPFYAHKARILRFACLLPVICKDDQFDVRSQYSLRGPYFYIPGQFWAHKNHLTAIRALSILTSKYSDVSIVCSGSQGDLRNENHYGAICAEVSRLRLENRFLMLGKIPYKHIAWLMLNSHGVVNPSLFEGWSTCVEEAMAIGVPLVLSNIGVHREQCPNGEADFFEPLDPLDLASCLEKRLLDINHFPINWDFIGNCLAQQHLKSKRFADEYCSIISEL